MTDKETETEDITPAQDEVSDSPLLDTLGAAVKKMIARGKDRGYVTYDELNTALPPESMSSEQIEDTMSMLSEMGINVVDTLQPEAVNMSPAYLKQRYGDRLAFHGCISTAGPVAYATPEEVDAYCRQTLETMMPGGGYCFAPTHSLQDNSPTENVVAMYQAAFKHGWY